MKKINRIVLVCSLAIAALLVFTLTARAAVVTNTDVPITEVVFNPCNGEVVTFTGVQHFTAIVTLDSAGGFHGDLRSNLHLTATGDQGNFYELNQEDSFTSSGRVGIVQTLPFTTEAISKGSAPNFQVHIFFHMTVLANGTTTASIDTFTSSCRG